MYAAVGLFGVVAFHDAGPVGQAVSDGYGIAYATTAKAETSRPVTATSFLPHGNASLRPIRRRT